MRLQELQEEEKKEESHTFIGLRLSNESAACLRKWMVENKVTFVGSSHDNRLHLTLIYSKKVLPPNITGNINLPIVIKPNEYTLENLTSEKGNALVLKITSNELQRQHKYFREKYGATHDYDEYLPHVTLTYDFNAANIDKLKKPTCTVVLNDAYQETKIVSDSDA